jgi:hypothetical protein
VLQKLPKYAISDPHMLCKISFHILYTNYVHRSTCQFVYRGSVGAICRIQNNRYLIFSPPAREPAIQKSAQVWNEGCTYVLEKKMQCLSKNPMVTRVNLYVTEIPVLFVGQGTIETLFSTCHTANLRSKNCLNMETGICICSIKSHVDTLYRDSSSQLPSSICISQKSGCYL